MDLRALKARRDLDADAVTRSLQGIKNIREEAGESLQILALVKWRLAARIWAMTCMRGKQILRAAYDGRQNFIRRRPR